MKRNKKIMIIKFVVDELETCNLHTVYNALILGNGYKHSKEKSSTLVPAETKIIEINTDTKELTTNAFYGFPLGRTAIPEMFIKVKDTDEK